MAEEMKAEEWKIVGGKRTEKEEQQKGLSEFYSISISEVVIFRTDTYPHPILYNNTYNKNMKKNFISSCSLK